MRRLAVFVILVAVLCFVHQADSCCCCGGGGSSSSGDKGGNSLNGMIMGFMLARMSTGNAALANSYRNALLVQQYPTNPMEALVARTNPLSLVKLRALRQQHGFGFLWGTQRAKKLRHIAEEVDAKKHLHGWPFAVVKKSIKVKDPSSKNITTTTSKPVSIPPETKRRLKTKAMNMDAHIFSGRAPEWLFQHGPLRLGLIGRGH